MTTHHKKQYLPEFPEIEIPDISRLIDAHIAGPSDSAKQCAFWYLQLVLNELESVAYIRELQQSDRFPIINQCDIDHITSNIDSIIPALMLLSEYVNVGIYHVVDARLYCIVNNAFNISQIIAESKEGRKFSPFQLIEKFMIELAIHIHLHSVRPTGTKRARE